MNTCTAQTKATTALDELHACYTNTNAMHAEITQTATEIQLARHMHCYTDATIRHSHSIHFHRLDSSKLPSAHELSNIFSGPHKHHFFNSTCHRWDSMSTLRFATRSSQLTPDGQCPSNLWVGLLGNLVKVCLISLLLGNLVLHFCGLLGLVHAFMLSCPSDEPSWTQSVRACQHHHILCIHHQPGAFAALPFHIQHCSSLQLKCNSQSGSLTHAQSLLRIPSEA